jgi:mRNA interferase MazF
MVGSVPEVLVSYISSVMPSPLLPSDLVLDPARPEFRSTNLKTLSTLRLHKLATIHTSSLVRYLGVVDASTFKIVVKKLTALLGL